MKKIVIPLPEKKAVKFLAHLKSEHYKLAKKAKIK
jgi:hypothetical protein